METKQVSEKKLQPEKIEYETVTLEVPKKLMDWLRAMEKVSGCSPIEELEYDVVDMIRSNIEAMSGMEIIEQFNLGPIFRTLLEDKRF